jgi:hypothetical protein
MRVRRLLILVALLAAADPVSAIQVVPQASLGFRSEPGVETKAFLSAGAKAAAPFGGFWGSIAFSAGDNPGIAYYGVGAEARLVRLVHLRLRGQVNHNQWSDWRAGENSASLMLLVRPVRVLDLGVGAAWRAPVFDRAGYQSPFRWQSPAPEWNLLYRVQWSLIQRRRMNLAIWVANDDPLTPHPAQQFPFGLRGSLKVLPRWWLNARLGSDIKGLSGGLFSLGEVDARVGVSYGP